MGEMCQWGNSSSTRKPWAGYQMGLAPNLNERSYFLMSAIRLETDDMPIEHILGHIGNEVMQWTIAQLSPKAPNEWIACTKWFRPIFHILALMALAVEAP